VPINGHGREEVVINVDNGRDLGCSNAAKASAPRRGSRRALARAMGLICTCRYGTTAKLAEIDAARLGKCGAKVAVGKHFPMAA